jgi:hypothetical protein
MDGSGSTNNAGEYVHDDGLLFVFETNVWLEFMNLGEFYNSNNDDFNITVDGITRLVDYDNDEPNSTTAWTLDNDKFGFSGLYGKEFLIWADSSNDEFLIDSIRVRVPEPNSNALFMMALLLIAISHRINKKT